MVAIPPMPAFRPIFEVATTRASSGIVLINETPLYPESPEAESLCSWWSPGEATTSKEFSQLPTALTRKHASRFCLQPVNTGPRGQEQDTPILSPTQIRRQLW